MSQYDFKREVLVVGLHFLITLALIGGYIYTYAMGRPDPTLQNAVMVITGYWFSVLSKNTVFNQSKSSGITTPADTQIDMTKGFK